MAAAVGVTTVRIDASRRLLDGIPIARSMVGCAFETFDHQLVGGLYSQEVWGESFEEPPGPDGVSGSEPHFIAPHTTVTWRVPSDSSRDAMFERSNVSFNGNHSQMLRLDGASSTAARIQNYGLDGQGMYLRAGAHYHGYLYARVAMSPSTKAESHHLTVSLRDRASGETFSQVNLTVPSNVSAWVRLNFTLPHNGPDSVCWNSSKPLERCGANNVSVGPHVPKLPYIPTGGRIGPEHVCIECSGALDIALHTAGTNGILLDQVFMERRHEGPSRFAGLHIREEVGESIAAQRVNAFRLGGTACLSKAYNWHRFRGPAWLRQPYAGVRYGAQSAGFDMFEVMDLAEVVGANSISITLNPAVETETSVAEFVEYCFGNASTPLGYLRGLDGHPEPRHFAEFIVELGNNEEWHPTRPNGQPAGATYVERFVNLTTAMDAKLASLNLPFELTYGLAIRPDGSGQNYTVEEKEMARSMLRKISFLGNRVRWDWHAQMFNYDDPSIPPEQYPTVPGKMRALINSVRSSVKLGVLEEDGAYSAQRHGHDLARALAHARFSNSLLRIGNFARFEAPVLCVEPVGRFDNGGDQGQTMILPNTTFGSPQYWSASMIADAYEPWLVQATLVHDEATSLDVVVVANDASATRLILRVVNTAGVDAHAQFVVSGMSRSCAQAKIVATSLHSPARTTSAKKADVNTPSKPRHISPVTRPIGDVPVLFGNASLSLCFQALSFTTLVFECHNTSSY